MRCVSSNRTRPNSPGVSPARRAITGDIDLVGSLMVNYRSEQQIHDNQDPNMVIDAVSRTNLRIGVEGDKWLAAFVGKNLTNEKVLSYAGNVPLSSSTFGTNTFFGFVERGRQLALEVGCRF